MQPVDTDWNSINSRAFSQGENRRPGSLSVVTAPQRGRWHFPTAASKTPARPGRAAAAGRAAAPAQPDTAANRAAATRCRTTAPREAARPAGARGVRFPHRPVPRCAPAAPGSHGSAAGFAGGSVPPARRNRRVNPAEKQTADRRTDRQTYNLKPEQGGQSRGCWNGHREAAGSETP